MTRRCLKAKTAGDPTGLQVIINWLQMRRVQCPTIPRCRRRVAVRGILDKSCRIAVFRGATDWSSRAGPGSRITCCTSLSARHSNLRQQINARHSSYRCFLCGNVDRVVLPTKGVYRLDDSKSIHVSKHPPGSFTDPMTATMMMMLLMVVRAESISHGRSGP